MQKMLVYRLSRLLATSALMTSVMFAASPLAQAQDTIKIGEINSYKAQPAFLEPYKRGWSSPSSRSMPRVG